MSAPDTYEAMSRGTIDGTLLPYSSIESYKLPAKYVSVGENFGPVAGHYMISERRWKTIPSHLQRIMQDAGRSASRRACALIDKEEDEELARLRQRQIVSVSLEAADKRRLTELSSMVAQEWADALDRRGKPGGDVLKEFNDALTVAPESARR
jgi:TRAP-type C4-dicarboxylate transport system substrate-binding protein